METFFSPRTVKGDQLSLLDRVSSTPKTLTVAQLWDAVAGRAYTAMTAIPPAKPRQDEMRFHREASVISKDDFTLFLSYKGRGYRLKGAYRSDAIHSGHNEDVWYDVSVMPSIRIQMFNNGNYVPCELNERSRQMFMQAAHDMLSSPLSSRSMTTH